MKFDKFNSFVYGMGLGVATIFILVCFIQNFITLVAFAFAGRTFIDFLAFCDTFVMTSVCVFLLLLIKKGLSKKTLPTSEGENE